jgi:hypothetical protein
MKLDLNEKQRKALQKGKSIQLKHEQIGRGFNVNLHPMNEKKILKAYRGGRGVRVDLTGGEIGMEGGKFSLNRTMKDIGIKKKVNQTIKKTAPVVRTINRGLKTAGLDSIQEMAINQAIDFLPVPAPVKTIIAKQVTKQADKAIAGAGFKGGRLANPNPNPYLPTAFMTGQGFRTGNDGVRGAGFKGAGFKGGKLPISSKGSKVYEDQRNVLRPNQSGFIADAEFDPSINPHVFDGPKQRGGSLLRRVRGRGIR